MITLDNIKFSYKKDSPVFNNLNLQLEKGKIYGLLGKNGAGKTTLLKILSGLLFPQNGNCKILEKTPSERNPEFLSDLYFIPEEFSAPKMKIKTYEEIYSPFYPNFKKDDFFKFLDEYELSPNKNLASLSYGQRKKIYFAFALAVNSKILFLDEPTNGLDIPSKSIFRRQVASHLSDENLIIISTHQVKDVQNLIDHLIILEKGEILLNAGMPEISNKLRLTFRQTEPAENTALYYQKITGGYSVISENPGNEETEIDLEILFNAFLSKGNKLLNVIEGN